MVILEQDHTRFVAALDRLREEANAKMVFLVDKTGQNIAASGDLEEIDPTSLASLTAGNVAATEGLAQQLGDSKFTTLYHEGDKDSLHLSLVSNSVILLVIFDERSSLGLVRLRVKQSAEELEGIVDEVLAREGDEAGAAAVGSGVFAEISDEDIDALFG